MSLPILIIGAGGHGRVVAELLRAAGRRVLGFLDPAREVWGSEIDGVPVLGDDCVLQCHPSESVRLANGVGSVRSTHARRAVYERLAAAGFEFEALCHPATIVSSFVGLSPGVQIMAGAILQPGVLVGENTVINTGALVDHDCKIGPHCHIAPGAVLSGLIEVGAGCHIGTAATIIQGVRIGAGALIAAGAVVVEDIPDGAQVAGMPARPMGKS